MENTRTKQTDLELTSAATAALRNQMGAAAGHITVAVQDGVVTLEGVVATAADKLEAETAAQRIPGVLAIAEELRLCTDNAPPMTDADIARNILGALARGAYRIGRSVTIRVEHGWVSLAGTASSRTEYLAVERALECVPGVRGVSNQVEIEEGSAAPLVLVAPINP